MKVYIILFWFWEGDSYLVNSFVDCKKTMKESLILCSEEAKGKSFVPKLFVPGEDIPKEDDGHYGTPGFFQIIEKEL